MRAAICPGSFDPPTNGHLNIIERGIRIFDRLIVAVAVNMSKEPIFSAEERAAMLREIFANHPKIEIDFFDGLLAEYARKRKIHRILRGIRTMSDYEYEFQMALANKTLYPELEIIFLMTEGRYTHLSSSIIKDVVRHGGRAAEMIHPLVEQQLRAKLCRKEWA
ncbi:MAG: pantetheine-phosphate adenylyltransferase [Deltaproteobacteria bacterium]|nr:pantetheine-phosphate adenylyltransferase [Deltaproteobacteria bacterium]